MNELENVCSTIVLKLTFLESSPAPVGVLRAPTALNLAIVASKGDSQAFGCGVWQCGGCARIQKARLTRDSVLPRSSPTHRIIIEACAWRGVPGPLGTRGWKGALTRCLTGLTLEIRAMRSETTLGFASLNLAFQPFTLVSITALQPLRSKQKYRLAS